MNKKIFVSGATGLQGSNIAQLFLSQGAEVISLSSSVEKAQANNNDLQWVHGGFEDKPALSNALQNVDAAVFTFPLIFDVEKAKTFTSNFIETAEIQGVPLVVFNAGFDLPKAPKGLLAMDLKIAIKELFEKSNLNVITLMPDIYVDNLAAPWSIPAIVENGVLPYPIKSGEKVPWISHTDLAKFVVSAAQKPELAGQTLPIGGNLWTGEEIADAIAKHIDQPVQFIGLTPDDFEAQLAPAFGPLAAREIANLYRYVDQNKAELVHKDFQKTQQLLSVQAQSIQEWVASVAWKN